VTGRTGYNLREGAAILAERFARFSEERPSAPSPTSSRTGSAKEPDARSVAPPPACSSEPFEAAA